MITDGKTALVVPRLRFSFPIHFLQVLINTEFLINEERGLLFCSPTLLFNYLNDLGLNWILQIDRVNGNWLISRTFAVENDVHVRFSREGDHVLGQPVAVPEIGRETQGRIIPPFEVHFSCGIFVWNNRWVELKARKFGMTKGALFRMSVSGYFH